tara:strand:+ start:1067 stop:1453 length:387 start_codon:yes stop_codon:yes gene_type:complete
MLFTFPKKEKLKSKKLFTQLFEEGKSISTFPFKLIYVKTALPPDIRIQTGVSVPKKKVKSAVKRNRIKRLVREAYRLNKHLVFNNSEGSFAFLILYLGKEMPSYPEVEKDIRSLLQKFIKTVNDDKNT